MSAIFLSSRGFASALLSRPARAALASCIVALASACASPRTAGPAGVSAVEQDDAGAESEPGAEAVEVAPDVAIAAPLGRAAVEAIVTDPSRSEADRETDRRRAPLEFLLFCGLRPGMRVADLGAGSGYTSELLARAVGTSGRVYGHNTIFVRQRFAAEPWAERLAKPVNATIVDLESDFDAPFSADIRDLDLVVNVLFYHDFEWQGVDRASHNANVFAALRAGGHYVIVDASAAEGAGVSASKTLHRIEEAVVVRELEAAGFELVARGDFLANPDDTRDWNATPWSDRERAERGEFSDKFVLDFHKPVP